MIKGILKGLAKISISAGLIWILVSQTEIQHFFSAVKELNIYFFSIALAISAGAILIRAYKWNMLLMIQGGNISFGRIHALNYMSMFFNNFFFGSLGGDIFKIYKVMGFLRTKTGAVASIALEKLTNVMALLTLVSIFGLYNLFVSGKFLETAELSIVVLASLGLITVICGFFILWSYGGYSGRLRMIPVVGKPLELFLEAVKLYRHRPKVVIKGLLLSMIFFLVNTLGMYCFVIAGNEDISLANLAFIVSLASLVVMIPISLNGIGLLEGTFFFYFDRLGMDPSAALLISLLPRINMLIFSLIGGLCLLFDDLSYRRETGLSKMKK